jgi:hypothetical protein
MARDAIYKRSKKEWLNQGNQSEKSLRVWGREMWIANSYNLPKFFRIISFDALRFRS